MTENCKVAVVTGASRGLGKAMCEEFKNRGFAVVGVSRSKPDVKLDKWLQGDITDKVFRKKLVKQVKKKFGRADVLINNAGRGNYATWEEFSDKELRAMFELNLFALVALIKDFLPLLKESRGTIINIASVAGKVHVPCMGAYCATKFGVCALSDSIRPELAIYGIKALNVMPGRINTGFSDRALGGRVPPKTPGCGASAAGLATAVYRAWKRGRKSLIYPGWYRLFILVARLFPRFYDGQNIKLWKIDE